MQANKSSDSIEKFTPYQKFVVIMLAFLQFTIVLDFMILSPLGAMLIPSLKITPAQFGLVVSAYAFSAGASGLLTAGFADRFDRKKLLLFFYSGFILGTLFCGLAPNYYALLIARMVTGIFGGVIGSIVFAITTDLFPMNMRGRVMGVVQTSLAASQVLGIPLGLYFANLWGWHAPFIMIVVVGAIAGLVIFLKLNSITEHLKHKSEKSPLRHLVHTLSKPRYLQGFAATALLSTGGFMIMPFSSAFIVHNVGISLEKLPMIYVVTGLCSIVMGPLIGRACDSIGKFPIFLIGTVLTLTSIFIYTRMGVSSIEFVMFINVVLFAGITSRIIASGALSSAIPISSDRGAYMSVSSSLQQISGGLASALAGLIVSEGSGGMILHFDQLGLVVIGSGVVTLVMMYFINDYVKGKSQTHSSSMTMGHD